jgi:hypothetical protein
VPEITTLNNTITVFPASSQETPTRGVVRHCRPDPECPVRSGDVVTFDPYAASPVGDGSELLCIPETDLRVRFRLSEEEVKQVNAGVAPAAETPDDGEEAPSDSVSCD